MSVRIGLLMILTVILVAGLWRNSLSKRENPQSLYEAALQAIDDSDFRKARDIIGKLEKVPQESSRTGILLGKLNLHINLPANAIDELQPVLADEAFRIPALTMLGEAFNTLGRYHEAEQVLLEAIAVDPSNIEARRWLAASYYDIGAVDLAMEQLAIVSQQAPDDPRPNRLRGLIQKDFERYQGAIEDYTEALRRTSVEDVRQEILPELAECQVRQHLFGDAEKTLSEASVTADSLVLQARCAQAADRPDTVASLIEQALLREPANLEALLFQAEILLDRNDLLKAVDILEKAVAAWPMEPQPRYQLLNVFRRLGKHTEADAMSVEMQRIQKLNEEFTALHELAFADTRNAEIRFRLGEVSVKLDKLELADLWYTAALGIEPDHLAARIALQKLRAERSVKLH